MRKLAAICLILTLGCASPGAPSPGQTFLALCGAYTVAATRAADMAQAGLFTPEEILTLRHLDGKMYEACKAGDAMLQVGMDPSDATAIVVSLLPAFEQYLLERAGRAPGSNPVDNGIDAIPLIQAP